MKSITRYSAEMKIYEEEKAAFVMGNGTSAGNKIVAKPHSSDPLPVITFRSTESGMFKSKTEVMKG